MLTQLAVSPTGKGQLQLCSGVRCWQLLHGRVCSAKLPLAEANSFCNWAAGQMTEGVTLAFALRRLRASVPLLAPFDKLQRKFLKQALSVFGSAENAPRVQAILFMRAMAVQLPPPMLDSVLKVSGPAESCVVHTDNCMLPDSLLLVNAAYTALGCHLLSFQMLAGVLDVPARVCG